MSIDDFYDKNLFVAYTGQNFTIPCDISGEHGDDTIILILWYRNDSVRPIYTVDARKTSLKEASHSSEVADRMVFNINYPISKLLIKTVEKEDEAEYKCRIDYRIGRTVYRTMRLTVLGKIKLTENSFGWKKKIKVGKKKQIFFLG
uniref:Ig-like domain-containing protein n=1 Tax=Tetranychus urticae TaxID=32264 RepID=T1KLT4_TETUR